MLLIIRMRNLSEVVGQIWTTSSPPLQEFVHAVDRFIGTAPVDNHTAPVAGRFEDRLQHQHAELCATRSRMQGMPNGRNFPGCFFGIRPLRCVFGSRPIPPTSLPCLWSLRSFTGVSGFRHSRDPSPFGHRSSPEAPSLHRHYPASPVLQASPPPWRPRLPLAGSQFGVYLTTHRASHVAASFPFHACQRHYPGGSKGVPASLASPSVFGLPHFSGGSASALPVSRPARRSLAFRPACSLNRLMRPFDTRVLQTISLPP